MPEEEPYIDRTEAARLMGCSPKTITRLILAGRLKAGDIGTGLLKYYRIKRADVLAYQEAAATLPPCKRRGRRKAVASLV